MDLTYSRRWSEESRMSLCLLVAVEFEALARLVLGIRTFGAMTLGRALDISHFPVICSLSAFLLCFR